jgi:hypothetical protein
MPFFSILTASAEVDYCINSSLFYEKSVADAERRGE